MRDGAHDGHHPLVLGRVPEHLRVTELAIVDVQDRIAGVARPGPAAVGAVGQRLLLVVRLGRGVDRDHRRVLLGAETAGVAVVHHRAAREGHLVAELGDRQRQLLPVHEVLADRVAPGHVAPRVPERVVLVEEVVLALVVDHPVRVVHPVLRRREMKLRAIRLAVRRRLRDGGGGRRGKCNDRARGSDDPPITAHVALLLMGTFVSLSERFQSRRARARGQVLAGARRSERARMRNRFLAKRRVRGTRGGARAAVAVPACRPIAAGAVLIDLAASKALDRWCA